MAQRQQPLPGREVHLRWLIGLAIELVCSVVFIELAGDLWLREGFAWDVPLLEAIHHLNASNLIMR